MPLRLSNSLSCWLKSAAEAAAAVAGQTDTKNLQRKRQGHTRLTGALILLQLSNCAACWQEFTDMHSKQERMSLLAKAAGPCMATSWGAM
jgi:hypothetical protein